MVDRIDNSNICVPLENGSPSASENTSPARPGEPLHPNYFLRPCVPDLDSGPMILLRLGDLAVDLGLNILLRLGVPARPGQAESQAQNTRPGIRECVRSTMRHTHGAHISFLADAHGNPQAYDGYRLLNCHTS